MNQTSLAKIQTAATFLRYFRRCVPLSLQAQIRPYLDQPYQLALNILDCCEEREGCTADAIAHQLKLSKSSVRQVLSALREGGLVLLASPAKGWIPLDLESLETTLMCPDRVEPVRPS